MLSEKFEAVAIDQWFHRRFDDVESKFFQAIASQGPRNDFQRTTQGFYIADANGSLIAYYNNRGPDRIRQLMIEATKTDQPPNAKKLEVDSKSEMRKLEDGTLVVQVNARVLSGYSEPRNDFDKIFQQSISRDNLWINPVEQRMLVTGEMPDSLTEKIVRYHLLDNTRGEPKMWAENEIKSAELTLSNGKLVGSAEIETDDGKRGFQVDLLGEVSVKDDSIEEFNLVAKGMFWGEGPYTQGAPKGKFPLAIAFRIAKEDDDIAYSVLPQAIKNNGHEYE